MLRGLIAKAELAQAQAVATAIRRSGARAPELLEALFENQHRDGSGAGWGITETLLEIISTDDPGEGKPAGEVVGELDEETVATLREIEPRVTGPGPRRRRGRRRAGGTRRTACRAS